LFVKIGEVKPGSKAIKSSCVLPGTKLREQEPTAQALQRVLTGDLAALAPELRVSSGRSQVQEVEMKQSSTYGIRTRYLRTTVTAWLSEFAKLKKIALPVGFDEFMNHYEAADDRFCATKLLNKLYLTAAARATGIARVRATQILTDVPDVVILAPEDEDESLTLYLWLRPHDFEVLASEAAAPILKLWAQQIHVSEQAWRELSSAVSVDERVTKDAQSTQASWPPNADWQGMEVIHCGI